MLRESFPRAPAAGDLQARARRCHAQPAVRRGSGQFGRVVGGETERPSSVVPPLPQYASAPRCPGRIRYRRRAVVFSPPSSRDLVRSRVNLLCSCKALNASGAPSAASVSPVSSAARASPSARSPEPDAVTAVICLRPFRTPRADRRLCRVPRGPRLLLSDPPRPRTAPRPTGPGITRGFAVTGRRRLGLCRQHLNDLGLHSSARLTALLLVMADCVKTLQVRLQQDGFLRGDGTSRDSAIDYPCPVEPFAPVLLGSPVVLHVYCPDLFPGKVLKVHAEHLGHFTGIRNVPRVNDEHERALFSGLCGLFGRERVIGVYDETLVDGSLREEVKKARSRGSDDGAWPKVFVAFQSKNRDRARQTLALLRKLTRLFDLNELRDADIPYVRGQEPAHMLFLYAIQLTALFLSSCADERILATIMSVASAPFLEANFCDPLCAATLLKPMFLPWYESLPRKADEADQSVDPETKLQYYRLFTGYGDSRDDLAWTRNSVQLRARGYKIEESSGKALWFVAPGQRANTPT
ncbi:hypothetical protein Q5P01_000749 [Channa striata]|uniref:Uncharacterized protein n=1 Tax=Channa striata TaxID=64152 RepID=A0AA88LMA5_CHASR|nr:hypothetical protein Q5P01_000749 [Channa striata]